jgi:hypothetical protein
VNADTAFIVALPVVLALILIGAGVAGGRLSPPARQRVERVLRIAWVAGAVGFSAWLLFRAYQSRDWGIAVWGAVVLGYGVLRVWTRPRKSPDANSPGRAT